MNKQFIYEKYALMNISTGQEEEEKYRYILFVFFSMCGKLLKQKVALWNLLKKVLK
jgi:hypothetical protein